jgi:hypothetical protein
MSDLMVEFGLRQYVKRPMLVGMAADLNQLCRQSYNLWPRKPGTVSLFGYVRVGSRKVKRRVRIVLRQKVKYTEEIVVAIIKSYAYDARRRVCTGER